MKKTLLALALVSVSASFSASAAYVCTDDPTYNPASCSETTSPYATAKEGDVITIQNGVPVPVTPKFKTVALFDIASTVQCESPNTVCDFTGVGISELYHEKDGKYTVTLENPIPGAKYMVKTPACASSTVTSVVVVRGKTETSFQMQGRISQFHSDRKIINYRLWNCGQGFEVISYK